MRPELISQIHGAFLDIQQQPGAEDLEQRYEQLLSKATEQYGCTRQQLIHALRSDFHKWQQDEGLRPRRS
jgi:hypothetical protein